MIFTSLKITKKVQGAALPEDILELLALHGKLLLLLLSLLVLAATVILSLSES